MLPQAAIYPLSHSVWKTSHCHSTKRLCWQWWWLQGGCMLTGLWADGVQTGLQGGWMTGHSPQAACGERQRDREWDGRCVKQLSPAAFPLHSSPDDKQTDYKSDPHLSADWLIRLNGGESAVWESGGEEEEEEYEEEYEELEEEEEYEEEEGRSRRRGRRRRRRRIRRRRRRRGRRRRRRTVCWTDSNHWTSNNNITRNFINSTSELMN